MKKKASSSVLVGLYVMEGIVWDEDDKNNF
jgi:hypothetical protein